MPTKVAYLGPKGTYAEKAAVALANLEQLREASFLSCQGIWSVVEHLENDHCEAAVVPIENSVEGGVTSTLDALWRHKNLFICRALVIPIRHALLSNGSINGISEVLSHPQALAQCSGWLNNHLPKALQLPTNSTAEAMRMVTGSPFRAAIGDLEAGNNQELTVLEYPINDIPGNCTRFILLTKKSSNQIGNKASFAFSLKSNSPGSLLKALNCIAELGLNMTRIESRPSKRELGEYVFFIDLDIENQKNIRQEKIIELLNPYCNHIVHFGCYSNSEIK